MVIIDKMMVTLGLDKAGLAAGLAQAGSMLQNFGKMAAKIGALAGIAFGVKELINQLGKLKDYIKNLKATSDAVGVSTEYIQKWRGAALRAGVDTQEATVALREFSRRIGEAKMGFGEGAAGMKMLGISMRDAEGNFKSTEQLMLETADAISKIGDTGSKVAISNKIMAESGYRALAMMTDGSKGLTAAMEDTNAMSDYQVEALREAFIAWDVLVEKVVNWARKSVANVKIFWNAWSELNKRVNGPDGLFGNLMNNGKEFFVFLIRAVKNLRNVLNPKAMEQEFFAAWNDMLDNAKPLSLKQFDFEAIREVAEEQEKQFKIEKKIEKLRDQQNAKRTDLEKRLLKAAEERLKVEKKITDSIDERSKSSLKDIADLPAYNRFAMQQKFMAQRAMALEQHATFARRHGASRKYVEGVLGAADNIKSNLVGLNQEKENPQVAMVKNLEKIRADIDSLNKAAMGVGLNINPKTGK